MRSLKNSEQKDEKGRSSVSQQGETSGACLEEKEETPVEHCSWWLGCWGNGVVYLPFVAGEL